MSSGQDNNDDDLDFGPTLKGLQSGLKVFGRYSLIRQLGRGGMGVVWLGQDEKLDGREVALKFLPDLVQGDQAAINDLKKETMQCLDLTHPSIVRIYDWVEDGTSAAISMEYVDGETLTARRLAKGSEVFEVGEITEWIGQACEGLEYAHGRKVVHRDLKPANLMIDGEGKLRVLDFGIAGSLTDSMSRLTSGGAPTSGTLVYMSPQQAMGYPPTATDDVYALGATIYELLTGRPPFYRGNVQHQIETLEPPSMKDRRAELGIEGVGEIPQVWEDAVADCLAKETEDRPESTEALWAELSGGRTPGVKRKVQTGAGSGNSKSSKKKLESEPVASGKKPLVFAAVIVLAGVLGAGWWFGIDAPKRALKASEREQNDLALHEKQWKDERNKEQAEQERLRQDAELKGKVKAMYKSLAGVNSNELKKSVYDEVLKIDPDNVQAKEDLAEVEGQIAAQEMADKTAQLEKAAEALRRENDTRKKLEAEKKKREEEERVRTAMVAAKQKEADRLAEIQRAKDDAKRREEMKRQEQQNKANSIATFLRNFIESGESNQVEASMSYYASSLQSFYDEGRVSKDFVREGRRDYINKYPRRSYAFVQGESTKVTDLGGGYYSAQVRFDYRVSGSKTHSGRMLGIYKLRDTGSGFEIVEIDEKKQ